MLLIEAGTINIGDIVEITKKGENEGKRGIVVKILSWNQWQYGFELKYINEYFKTPTPYLDHPINNDYICVKYSDIELREKRIKVKTKNKRRA